MRQLILIGILFTSLASKGQKIAKYISGTPGKDDYQEISFWSDKRILLKVFNTPEQAVTYHGSTLFANERAFLLMLPGNQIVRVSVSDEGKLFLTGLSSKYFKSFIWVHGGGAVDKKGICASCTLNEQEATKLLRKNFL